MSITQHAVVIVGAGPAGSAAALRIASRRPDLAERTVVVERRTFPRDKLCAGGLSSLSYEQLARLGVAPAVPTCRVAALELRVGERTDLLRRRESGSAFRTVRRTEFDSALVELVRRQGVEVHEGERVTAIEHGRSGVSVVTEGGEHRALAAIGADGVNGVARRAIGDDGVERGFALEVLIPGDAREVAVVDFAPVKAGIGGYCWIFPSRDDGSPRLNCGIAVCTPDGARSGRLARSFLVEWLASQGIRCEASSIRGHGAIAYDPDAPLGTERVCVAGDAAGIDPFLGEGIPCALGTGIEAADAVTEAIDRADFDFTRYHERVRASAIGRVMVRRRAKAHARYGRDPVERYLYAVGMFGRLR